MSTIEAEKHVGSLAERAVPVAVVVLAQAAQALRTHAEDPVPEAAVDSAAVRSGMVFDGDMSVGFAEAEAQPKRAGAGIRR